MNRRLFTIATIGVIAGLSWGAYRLGKVGVAKLCDYYWPDNSSIICEKLLELERDMVGPLDYTSQSEHEITRVFYSCISMHILNGFPAFIKHKNKVEIAVLFKMIGESFHNEKLNSENSAYQNVRKQQQKVAQYDEDLKSDQELQHKLRKREALQKSKRRIEWHLSMKFFNADSSDKESFMAMDLATFKANYLMILVDLFDLDARFFEENDGKWTEFIQQLQIVKDGVESICNYSALNGKKAHLAFKVQQIELLVRIMREMKEYLEDRLVPLKTEYHGIQSYFSVVFDFRASIVLYFYEESFKLIKGYPKLIRLQTGEHLTTELSNPSLFKRARQSMRNFWRDPDSNALPNVEEIDGGDNENNKEKEGNTSLDKEDSCEIENGTK